MNRITEQASQHRHLETKTTAELTQIINDEDKTVAYAVEKSLAHINLAIDLIYDKMKQGGRLFYIGAGTSGRLGILDASECPPTFGVEDDWIIGLISGGDAAIRKAQEFAEDDTKQAWKDLVAYDVSSGDVVLGLAASGTTPYVVSGLETAQAHQVKTVCITCNPDSPLSKVSDVPIEAIVGPEVVTGSTRMKSGTAQKMILNIISTAVMIKLGRVKDNKMVDMQLSNNKLVERGVKMIMDLIDIDQEEARRLLLETGSVREAIGQHNKNL